MMAELRNIADREAQAAFHATHNAYVAAGRDWNDPEVRRLSDRWLAAERILRMIEREIDDQRARELEADEEYGGFGLPCCGAERGVHWVRCPERWTESELRAAAGDR